MPTRKQRRRREKGRRHEWEEVLVYPDGREVPVDEVEEETEEEPQPKAERSRGGTRSRQPARPASKRASSSRRGRTVEPPSWRRVLKRALIFAPIMFLLVSVTGSDEATGARVMTTLLLVFLFIPFAYLMDSMAYRFFRKRQDKDAGRATAKR